MDICKDCKQPTNGICCSIQEDGKFVRICWDCWEKREKKRVEAALETVKHPSDFRTWDMHDMSDAFWEHLGRYKKKPNKKSLEIMRLALLWAYHADRGLSSSFTHALKWCGIDTFEEQRRKDLPETDDKEE